MAKMPVILLRRDARALVRKYDALMLWITNHAELCEEPDVLKRLDRDLDRAGAVIDQIEAQLKA